jgi:hypothetical protein
MMMFLMHASYFLVDIILDTEPPSPSRMCGSWFGWSVNMREMMPFKCLPCITLAKKQKPEYCKIKSIYYDNYVSSVKNY